LSQNKIPAGDASHRWIVYACARPCSCPCIGRMRLSVATSMAAACCMHACISCMICMRYVYVDQSSRGKAIRIPSGGAQLHICIAPYICMCP
jgi:hypothetical protein